MADESKWVKIAVQLPGSSIAALDRLAVDVRLRHGKAISRAEIIRGLLEASQRSGADLSDGHSVESIRDILLAKAWRR